MEVIIVKSGEVVHSKKNGQGHIDTTDKKEAIYKAVEGALAA